MKTNESIEQKQVNIDIALDLRLKGMSYRSIAKEMGVGATSAYRYVETAIKTIQEKYTEKAEMLVSMEREKLDRLEVGLIKATRGGDVKAANTMLKIMERRAKLLGIDKPSQTELELNVLEVSIKTPEDLK